MEGLDVVKLRTLSVRMLEVQGGVSLARSMMDIVPKQQSPPPPPSTIDWCSCGNCCPMPSPIENVCCRCNCITQYDVFQLICIHPVVLRVAVRNNCDWRADPVIYSHSERLPIDNTFYGCMATLVEETVV